MVNLIAALLSCVAVVLLVCWDILVRKPSDRHYANTRAAEDSGDITANSEPRRTTYPPYKEGWHPEESYHRQKEKRYWNFSLTFGVIGMVGALCAAGIAYLAFHETRRQADSAKEQIALTRDHGRRELRAYITYITANLDVTPDGFHRVEVDFWNAGKTPAYHVKTWMAVQAQVPNFNNFRRPKEIEDQDTGPVGPDGKFKQVRTRPLSASALQSLIKQGGAALFVWGEVTYEDAFGASRFLRYRLVYGRNEANEGGGFSVMNKGNDAN